MEISDFQWDEDNVAHIARHHVYPDEVEELAFDDEPWIRKEAVELGICWGTPFPDAIFL